MCKGAAIYSNYDLIRSVKVFVRHLVCKFTHRSMSRIQIPPQKNSRIFFYEYQITCLNVPMNDLQINPFLFSTRLFLQTNRTCPWMFFFFFSFPSFSLPARIYILAMCTCFLILTSFSSLQLVLLNRTLAERGLATWVDSFWSLALLFFSPSVPSFTF